MLAWAPVSTFAFESSGSFVFNDAQAQRDEGLRALLLVIVDAIQIYSLKYECLKVFCNLVDACPRSHMGKKILQKAQHMGNIWFSSSFKHMGFF